MKRPLVCAAAGTAAALVIICFVIPQHSLFAAVFCIFAALLCLFIPRLRQKTVLAVLLGAFAGSLLWAGYTHFIYDPVVNTYGGREAYIRGIACDFPEYGSGYGSIYVRVLEVDGEKANFRVRLYLDEDFEIEPGDAVSWKGKLEVPRESWYFNSMRYLRTKRIYLISFADTVLVDKIEPVWWTVPARTAGLLAQRLSQLMPERNSALMMALLIGDDSELDSRFSNDLRTAGLSHIIAVSGMNVAFLAAIILALFGRKRGGWIAIPAICFFMLMAGLTASVVRAGIMQIIGVIAYRAEKEYDSLTAMSLAAVIMFIINPYSAADAGLWMSFLAPLGLIVMSGPLIQKYDEKIREKVRNRVLRRNIYAFAGIICTTLSAQLFVLPLQALLFGRISLISPLANVLCVWAAELAFFAGFGAAGLSLVWQAGGKFLAFLAKLLTDYLYFLVPRMARLPFADADAGNIIMAAALILIYALLITSFLVFKRRKIPAVLLSLFILVSAVFTTDFIERHTIKITAADCVTGQSVIIHTKDQCTVINCGGSHASNLSTVLYYLRDNGIERIDSLILTDTRNASAGNAEKLMDSVEIGNIIMPPESDERADEIANAAEKLNISVLHDTDSGEIFSGKAEIKYYVNYKDPEKLMALIETGKCRVLVPGSIPAEELAPMMERAGIGGTDMIAGGDFYASHVLPASCEGLCIVSSYAEADPEIAGWMKLAGLDFMKTLRRGTVTLTVP